MLDVVTPPVVTPRLVAAALTVGIPHRSVLRGMTPGRLRPAALVRLARLVRSAAGERATGLPIRTTGRRAFGTAVAFGPTARAIVTTGGIGLVGPITEGTVAGPSVTFSHPIAGRGGITPVRTRCFRGGLGAIAVE